MSKLAADNFARGCAIGGTRIRARTESFEGAIVVQHKRHRNSLSIVQRASGLLVERAGNGDRTGCDDLYVELELGTHPRWALA